MPELPEVESIRRHLTEAEGAQITDVEACDDEVFAGDLSPDRAESILSGNKLRSVERRGKYLALNLGEGWLIYSLRMTGKVMFVEDCPVDETYWKLVCHFRDLDQSLYLSSVRRLSRIYWHEDRELGTQENIARLGPDPLSDDFDRDTFHACFEGRTGPIKTILMDQGFVAGVGNIYANELCFLAGIDPRRPCDEVTSEERDRLHDILPDLLKRAADMGGSSFTNFVGGDGEAGRYQREHRVYDREDDPCPSCGEPIQRVTLSNRSTYFCPECQA